MNFLKKIFGSKTSATTTSNEEFWNWFSRHATEFHNIVKKQEDVNDAFLEKLIPRLQSINAQFYCLTGMLDDDTAELIVTSDGIIKLFVFVEEFIQSAPVIPGWKFTALKPPTDIKSFSLNTKGYSFTNSNIQFCYNNEEAYPDEIDISLIYDNYTEENKESVTQGCLLFVENSLGELNMATMIDAVDVVRECPEGKEPIPIDKLEEFITWREKELVEKYEGTYLDLDTDTYALMEAEDASGLPVIALINQDILEWDAKASHPWMMIIGIDYDGKDSNGMPDQKTSELMNQFEDELTAQLSHSAGYLNLGRETYNNKRDIFFACKEFRTVSKATAMVISQYQKWLEVSYDIYKDRYWRSLDHFRQSRTI
ncbi:MAG TPA: DUF695 domain-containing protein [Puia sp.]